MYSGPGSKTVRLANGHDVAMTGAGHYAASGREWNRETRWPASDLASIPIHPNPPAPPNGNWFDTNIVDAALRTLGSSLYADNAINRSDMIALLQNVGDNGAVDATELSDLQKIVNTSTLFAGLGYVERLAEYVVLGSAANVSYAGQGLGNLAAGSSTVQLTNLVNKWFLGLDRPTASGTYRQVAGQLFVSGAAYTDIRQGQVGDCYLVASLAEVALRNQSIITTCLSSTAMARTP